MASPTTAVDPSIDLSTGAAHDLRNVMFVIAAQCAKLADAFDADDPRGGDVRAIGDAAERGVALARQLGARGRAAERPRAADVNATIRGVLPLVRRLVGDRIDVMASFDAPAWPVTANAVQLEQIVMNLAVNARDAMPAGGRLSISTENRLTLGSGGPLSPFVVITVTDTGAGIAPEHQARVFEPYFTTRADSGGTGVGLATVRAIALLHGGHVELSSAPGAGTTFRVALPRVDPPGDSSAERDGDPVDAVPAKRILLVENERAIRDFLARCLSGEGYEVRVAASGAEALDVCGTPWPPDLVVTDVHLPDLNGPEVVRHLRARDPGLRVMFMSGGPETVCTLEQDGPHPVLAKPFSSAEFVTGVASLLRAARH